MNTPNLATRLKNWRNAQSLTQQQLADKLTIKRSRLANFENGTSTPNSKILENLHALGFPKDQEVGPPLIPASQLLIPITYIGYVAASNQVNWTDPFESEDFEFVPPEMGDARGRFACKIESDSMFPLLEPHDVCVFQRTEVPKIGHIILFRSNDNRVTIKQLKHDGTAYVLHPINPGYEPTQADGNMLGFLVGIVRERGTQRLTIIDSSGILP